MARVEDIVYALGTDASACQFLFGEPEPPRFPRRKFGNVETDCLVVEVNKLWFERLENAFNKSGEMLLEHIRFTTSDPKSTKEQINALLAKQEEHAQLQSILEALKAAANPRYLEIRQEWLKPLLRLINYGMSAVLGNFQHENGEAARIVNTLLEILDAIARGARQCGIHIEAQNLQKIIMAQTSEVQPVIDKTTY